MIKISQASVLIPIIAGLLFYKRINTPFKWLTWFFILSAFVEIISVKIIHRGQHNNMPLLHLYTLIEFIAFGYMYYVYFKDRNRLKYFPVITLFTFIIIAGIDAIWINGIWLPNTVARSFECMVLVLLALMYYYLFFKESFDQVVWKQSMFWLSTGVLFYFAINEPFFMLYNFFLSNHSDMAKLGLNIHAVINIFTNILFAISFTCPKRKTY
ncbi:MAG: hypothetical protein Q8M15_17235 [Bacteroidota bacterium]|nr:hypothetical protein [Bacteroidota bacterium]